MFSAAAFRWRSRPVASTVRNATRTSSSSSRGLRELRELDGHERDDLIDRLKRPSRGGQNLSARHERLERSLRGKESYFSDIADLSSTRNENSQLQTGGARSTISSKGSVVFHGLVIPEAPRPPEADECCMSGCAICVYDLYTEALEAYDRDVASLRTALAERGIAESDWPAQLQTTSAKERKKDVVLSAFEQMELELAAKHSKDTGSGSSLGGAGNVSYLNSLPASAGVLSKRKVSEPRLTAASLYEALSWVIFSRR